MGPVTPVAPAPRAPPAARCRSAAAAERPASPTPRRICVLPAGVRGRRPGPGRVAALDLIGIPITGLTTTTTTTTVTVIVTTTMMAPSHLRSAGRCEAGVPGRGGRRRWI